MQQHMLHCLDWRRVRGTVRTACFSSLICLRLTGSILWLWHLWCWWKLFDVCEWVTLLTTSLPTSLQVSAGELLQFRDVLVGYILPEVMLQPWGVVILDFLLLWLSCSSRTVLGDRMAPGLSFSSSDFCLCEPLPILRIVVLALGK